MTPPSFVASWPGSPPRWTRWGPSGSSLFPSIGRVSTSGRQPSGSIEAALDINAHIIAELGAEVPDDYYGGFVKLGDLGVVPRELALSLAPSAGLRNRLVHEYESLDDATVLASIGALRTQYPTYVQAVESDLIKTGA